MRKRWVFLGLGTVVGLLAVATPIVLAPHGAPAPAPAAAAIDDAEHTQAIASMRQPARRHGRERPVIAILALNEATEITDLLVPYGVLQRANVADVIVVAEHATPVPLHPFSRFARGPELVRIDPQSTTRAFDARYPDGADYVIVPAMEPRNNPFVTNWIVAQHRKGARIISVCAGSLTIAAAGLLDGRRATTHWAYISDLQTAHPTMRWVKDRRYVVDDGVITTTGISASMPVAVALVEAIAGRPKAEQLAQELGLASWDARHRSSRFELGTEHKKTFVRNWLSLWRHETIGVPVDEGMDEIALALTADIYSRTGLGTVVTIGGSGEAVRSKHGLMVRPAASRRVARVTRVLPPPRAEAPALTMERELAEIALRFDRPTADIVALVMEYPWAAALQTR